MSFNTSHANGGVIIYNGEVILLYCDGVELSFEGNDVKNFQGTKKGKIFLTTHRMIFLNHNSKDHFQSFSTPFMGIIKIELEQPVFGANFIKGSVKSQEGGNWSGTGTFKMKFMKGGAIEFGQAMLQAAKMASRNMPPQPPAYFPAPQNYFPANPPVYMPPPQGYTGFVIPTQQFPNAPPPNSVFMYNAPPPYPGINSPPGYAPPPYGGQQAPQMAPGQQYAPQQQMNGGPQYGGQAPQMSSGQQYPPQQQMNGGLQYGFSPMGGAGQQQYPPPNYGPSAPYTNVGTAQQGSDAKSLEAAQSAYYNPYDPNNAYVPVPPPAYAPPNEQPPPYMDPNRRN